MGRVVMKVGMMLLMNMVHMGNVGKLALVDTVHKKGADTSNPPTLMMLMTVLGMVVHGSCSW